MAVYETILAREFAEMMKERRSINPNFSIMDITTPELDLITNESSVTGGVLASINGIVEPYFSDLNSSCNKCPFYSDGSCSKGQEKESCPRKIVEIVKDRTLYKKKTTFDENGRAVYRKDSNGEYMTEPIKVENGFVGVYSLVNIKLPNRVERNGVKRDYKPTKGYNFIHSVETDMGTKYLYTVPMEVVFPLDLCALVISLNKHKAYYKGCKIALTTGHYVYVYSIPYKYRENSGYKLIGAKPNPNFDKEMDELLKYWVNENILFDLKLTELQGNFDGNKNLGYQHLPGTRAYGDYVKTNKPLKEFMSSNGEEKVIEE